MTQLPSPAASLWRDTVDTSAAAGFLALDRDVDCDVAVVGGGYTGLHAAMTFAEAGLDTVVLEAGPIGTGGSGRNGGVVSAKFRRSFAEMAQSHGLETARKMHGISRDSVDHLTATLDRFGLSDVGFRKVGALKCAHNRRAFDHAVEEAVWLQDKLGETGLHVLDREAVEAETGSRDFVGGVLQDQAGTIQPLSYLSGLATALSNRGISIRTQSPVLSVTEAEGHVLLETPGGRVRARQVLMATNAYSSITSAGKDLSRCVVPFRSAMIATDVLPPSLDAKLLTKARSYTETRRMMRWFRKVDGRLLFGGRGALGAVDSPAAFRRLEQAMTAIFPDLGDIPIARRWSGHVALTFDGLPQAGAISDKIGYAIGFNGAGVAMSGYVGAQQARRMIGQPVDLSLIARGDLTPVPFFAFRAIGVRAVTFGYETLDALGF